MACNFDLLTWPDLNSLRDKWQDIHSAIYSETYWAIRDFCVNRVFDEIWLKQAALMVHGWMPTIAKLAGRNCGATLPLLEAAKSGEIFGEAQYRMIASSINGTMTGASKLLHFINPFVFPISDSWIARYLLDDGHTFKNVGGLNFCDYVEYQKRAKELADSPDNIGNCAEIRRLARDDRITNVRALEMALFYTSKYRRVDYLGEVNNLEKPSIEESRDGLNSNLIREGTTEDNI